MRWNHFAGTAIIPTLARIVLGLAFIAAGLHKIADHVEYSAEDAAILKSEFNVTLEEVVPAETVAWVKETGPQAAAQEEEGKVPPAGDETTAPNENETSAPPANAPTRDSAKPTEQQPGKSQADEKQRENAPPDLIEIPNDEKTEGAATQPAPGKAEAGKTYRGLVLFQIALVLHNNNIPNGGVLAWIAALTEFIGGILILVGLFSRVWGLGLTITMAMAFYLTSMHPYFVTVGPIEAGKGEDGGALFTRVFCQLGLGVLALTVFLVGPGPLSLDRLIFRPKREVMEVEEKE